MALVPNAGVILGRATSMYAAYGAILLFVLDKATEYLQSNQAASLTWREGVLGVLLFAIPVLRVWQQKSVTTETERKLQAEKLTRIQLEQVATTEGPPITRDAVDAIKRESAEATIPNPRSTP